MPYTKQMVQFGIWKPKKWLSKIQDADAYIRKLFYFWISMDFSSSPTKLSIFIIIEFSIFFDKLFFIWVYFLFYYCEMISQQTTWSEGKNALKHTHTCVQLWLKSCVFRFNRLSIFNQTCVFIRTLFTFVVWFSFYMSVYLLVSLPCSLSLSRSLCLPQNFR